MKALAIEDPRVVGLDLSLNSTGIAWADGRVQTFVGRGDGPGRIEQIRRCVMADMPVDCELAVIEGYSYGSNTKYIRELAELGGTIRNALWRERIAYLDVPPSTLKKVATSDGHANKVKVIQAAERKLGYEGSCDDEADALWLREIGWELLGQSKQRWTKAQTEALETLRKLAPHVNSRREAGS